jgi:catechol 2,3-dioxygenase-like lactoylglutathione lyase family enzyme
MDVAGFDHLNLTVRSLDESIAWYGRVFRFARVEEGVREGVRWAILRSRSGTGEAMLCMYERPEFGEADPEALPARRLHGIRHFGLRIESEAEWQEILRREGLDYEETRWPRSTAWYVNDPTGYEIEVSHWKEGGIGFGMKREARS